MRRLRKWASVVKPSSARRTTSPPWPPSPPSGPPLGMYFSRRKLLAPLPPWPEITVMLNLGGGFCRANNGTDGVDVGTDLGRSRELLRELVAGVDHCAVVFLVEQPRDGRICQA